MRAPGRRPSLTPFGTVLLSVWLAVPALPSAAEEPAAATPTTAAKSATVKPPARTAGTVAAAPVVPSDGTSLGEIVRKSKEEKGTAEPKKKKSLGTITNETLKKDGTGSSSTPPSGKKGSGTLNVLPKGSMPAPAAPPVAAARDSMGRTEQDWRTIMARNRTETEKAEADVKKLDQETKRLENDFYAWSDGNYRERVIRPNWDQAREELKKARAALDAAVASRADLEEEARKAGTPPGWLREQ
jgi:Spy/CpxP family protein refolding chaperone